jgi:hypothetical protein
MPDPVSLASVGLLGGGWLGHSRTVTVKEPEQIIRTVVRTVYVDRPVTGKNKATAIEYVTIDGLPIPAESTVLVERRDQEITKQAGEIERLRKEVEAMAVLMMAGI